MTEPIETTAGAGAVETNIGPWNDEARCARRRCQHPQSWHEGGACDEDTCPCPGFMDPAAQGEARAIVESTATSGGPVVTASYSSRPVVPSRDGGPVDDEAGDLLYEAWVLIANAYGGDWSQNPEWRAAAERWRGRWHATLSDGAPACTRCGKHCQQTWVRVPDGSVACFDCATGSVQGSGEGAGE
jgi:hypothetical protein